MKTSDKEFADTLPIPPHDESIVMELAAKWSTRIVYCLALLGIIVGQMGQASWIGLATGGGLLGFGGKFVFLLITSFLIYRIYLVLRYKATLRARKPNLFGWLFRGIGSLVMVAGALGNIAVFLIKPLTLLLLKSAGDNGIGFFVVGLYAVAVSSCGWIGCLFFELSRTMGSSSGYSRSVKAARLRKQDLGIGVAVILLVMGVPYLMHAKTGDECYGPNLIRCAAKVDGGVTRPAVVPFGDAVRLETNIDELVLIKQREPRTEVTENPIFSLLKSGHAAQDDASSAVHVTLDAVSSSDGVMITLKVFDAQGESAKFVTSFAKNTRLEPSNNGKQKIVVDLASNVFWGLHFPLLDPATNKRFVFDELYNQMRQAIVSPREFAEWSMKVPGVAKELSAVDVPPGEEVTKAGPSTSCVNILNMTYRGENETALQPSAGMPLNRLVFLAVTDPDAYILSPLNERIGCNSDGVWAFNYLPIENELEIRRFTNDGKLVNFVSTTLAIDKMKGQWADVDSPKIEGNKITFSAISGGWKRRTYE